MEYDLIIVGTGFASSFFLKKYLEYRGSKDRILVLERGRSRSLSDLIATRAEDGPQQGISAHYRREGMNTKDWNFRLGFGGSSNCWIGNTPRFLPADFETATRFGVGRDWPLRYEDLEPFYAETEQIMQISGSDEGYRHFRSNRFPLPPHNLSDPEKALQKAFPDTFFPMPTARASRNTATRNRCCGNDVCSLCPVDAKFTIENGLAGIYARENVVLISEALVHSLETSGGQVTGVEYTHEGQQKRATADLVVLGANALFNPVILANSGISHPLLGRRLHEQYGLTGYVFLDGMDSFQGSTAVTGIHYLLWEDEERRKERAPLLLETRSAGLMRTEPGRWRQVLPIRLVYEDIPSDENHVLPDKDNRDMAVAHFYQYSDYLRRAASRVHEDLEQLLAPLPVERIELTEVQTESHIQGTTVMGADAADSIVDDGCVHHQYRNLVVVGSSVFPSCSPANPTLTLSAIALRAAQKMVS